MIRAFELSDMAGRRKRAKATGDATGLLRFGVPGSWAGYPVLVVFLVLVMSATAIAQDTPDYYRQNCMNCHTIGGGRLTGPDLKDVGKRREAEWLISFMQNPKAVIDSGDPYAVKMAEESRGVVMPIAPAMTRYRAEQILKLLETESALEKSQFEGIRISNKPFTDHDRLNGHQLFLGTRTLKNGGAACIACHAMHDIPSLGGGRLGPDLTRVYERLKGRQSLSAWLMAPATETMQPIFRGHPLEAEEIHALAAYFESGATHGQVEPSISRIAFLLTGLAITVAVIFGFDVMWQGRLQSVRRALVEASSQRSRS